MIQLLGLLKNPITKLIAEKTIGAVTHKLKKDAIIKQKELDHANNVDIQSLKSSLDELNNAWNAVASKMYDSAKEDGSPQANEATSSKKKGKNKKKDDAEIEDADFEVVD